MAERGGARQLAIFTRRVMLVARRTPRRLEGPARQPGSSGCAAIATVGTNGYWLRAQAAHDTEVAEEVLADCYRQIRMRIDFNDELDNRSLRSKRH